MDAALVCHVKKRKKSNKTIDRMKTTISLDLHLLFGGDCCLFHQFYRKSSLPWHLCVKLSDYA